MKRGIDSVFVSVDEFSTHFTWIRWVKAVRSATFSKCHTNSGWLAFQAALLAHNQRVVAYVYLL